MEYLKEIVDYGIIGLLILMSVISLALFLERFFYYRRVDLNSFKSAKLLENDLTRNLTAIATIASNAPYIGLLGTVLAIMQTFIDMSKENMAVTTIMSSLALALKTTAVGLLVAIVAVVFYNYLTRKVETLLAEYEN
ncbi:MAG: TonB-system energizer ExbB [Epsilonproteobacteria bacterium]|nr:TonB-system energizer ExbB [Campylobacterota bacterium]